MGRPIHRDSFACQVKCSEETHNYKHARRRHVSNKADQATVLSIRLIPQSSKFL